MMDWIQVVLLLAAATLALSAMIVAKKPEARATLEKIATFQPIIGFVLVCMSVTSFIRVGPRLVIYWLGTKPVLGVGWLGGTLAGVTLGVLFAIPMISELTPWTGDTVVRALNPYRMILGLIAAAAAIVIVLQLVGLLN